MPTILALWLSDILQGGHEQWHADRVLPSAPYRSTVTTINQSPGLVGPLD